MTDATGNVTEVINNRPPLIRTISTHLAALAVGGAPEPSTVKTLTPIRLRLQPPSLKSYKLSRRTQTLTR